MKRFGNFFISSREIIPWKSYKSIDKIFRGVYVREVYVMIIAVLRDMRVYLHQDSRAGIRFALRRERNL